jgi:hypothetical protein
LALKFIPAELNMIPKLKPSQLLDIPMNLRGAKDTNQLELALFIKSCFSADNGIETAAATTAVNSAANKKKQPQHQKKSQSDKQPSLNLPVPTAGSPQVIIICSSALRCCALVPTLRKASLMLGKKADHVAKLFAKHQKVSS